MTVEQDNAFDIMLQAYLRWAEPLTISASGQLLDRLDLPAGSAVLDVGCGPGAFAVEAARAGCRVEAIDTAQAMLAVAAQRLAAFDHVNAEVMDATAMTYDDGRFDAAVAVFTLFFLGVGNDAALAEMVRVTRPGGQVAAVHWADPMGGPQFHYLQRAVERLGDPAVGPIRPWGFEYTDEAALAGVWRDAGLLDTRTQRCELAYEMPAPDDAFDELFSMFAHHPDLPELSDATRADLSAALAEEVAAVDSGAAARPVAVANLVIGTRPTA